MFKRNRLSLLILLLVLLTISFFIVVPSFRRQAPSENNPDLTQGFPQVTEYPGSSLVSSSNGNGEEGFLYEATWESSDSVPRVSQWYLSKFSGAKGWTVQAPPADPSASDIQLLVVNRDEYVFNFSFIKDESSGKTQIVVQILSQEQIEEEGEEE